MAQVSAAVAILVGIIAIVTTLIKLSIVITQKIEGISMKSQTNKMELLAVIQMQMADLTSRFDGKFKKIFERLDKLDKTMGIRKGEISNERHRNNNQDMAIGYLGRKLGYNYTAGRSNTKIEDRRKFK